MTNCRSRADGRERSALAEAGDFFAAAISGDGRSIAYSDISGSIFTVPRMGGAVEKLCAGCGTVSGLSQDGKQVAYEGMKDEDLTVFDAAQKKTVVVAKRPGPNYIFSGGRFSQDGRWMAFHAIATAEGTSRIWIVPATGRSRE